MQKTVFHLALAGSRKRESRSEERQSRQPKPPSLRSRVASDLSSRTGLGHAGLEAGTKGLDKLGMGCPPAPPAERTLRFLASGLAWLGCCVALGSLGWYLGSPTQQGEPRIAFLHLQPPSACLPACRAGELKAQGEPARGRQRPWGPDCACAAPVAAGDGKWAGPAGRGAPSAGQQVRPAGDAEVRRPGTRVCGMRGRSARGGAGAEGSGTGRLGRP